jgi:hypothetical protein
MEVRSPGSLVTWTQRETRRRTNWRNKQLSTAQATETYYPLPSAETYQSASRPSNNRPKTPRKKRPSVVEKKRTLQKNQVHRPLAPLIEIHPGHQRPTPQTNKCPNATPHRTHTPQRTPLAHKQSRITLLPTLPKRSGGRPSPTFPLQQIRDAETQACNGSQTENLQHQTYPLRPSSHPPHPQLRQWHQKT